MNAGWVVLIVFGGLLFIYLTTIFVLMPKRAYFICLFSGAYISVFKLIALKLRKQNVSEIVEAYVVSKKSRIAITLSDIMDILSAGGHPVEVVKGLIASKSAGLDFDLAFMRAIDISGWNVLEIIKNCTNPKVIEIPLISAVAKDNKEVSVKVSLTLKVNPKNLLKGVTEDTVSARAVEAVVTKVANTSVASSLTSRPELLDKAIFDAEIDSDSKFTLESADVIFVDVNNRRDDEIEKHLIEKQNMIEQNKIEQRRLTAVAKEQEEKVNVQLMKQKILEEEAKVPKAIVEAIKNGNFKDAVDFYKLQNLQADTEMRKLMAKNYKNGNGSFE